MLGGIGRAGRMMGTGAKRFSGYSKSVKTIGGNLGLGQAGPVLRKTQGGFSTMGKMRMGAAAGGAIGMSLRNNQKRGGYNPRSSATGGLQPKSSGGMGVGEF